MMYPIAIHKDPGADYGVTVPDLPGCFSAGSTVDEAMLMAREAITAHVELLVESGADIPPPSSVEMLRGRPEFADATWALVPVEFTHLKASA